MILCSSGPKKAKICQTRFLRNKENGETDSHICFTLHIEVSAGPEKVLKKRGANGFLGPTVKTDKITARPFWGGKKGEIQKFFFLQFTIDLGPIDAYNKNFFSDLTLWS